MNYIYIYIYIYLSNIDSPHLIYAIIIVSEIKIKKIAKKKAIHTKKRSNSYLEKLKNKFQAEL